jgi:hypothetical protein
MKKNDKQSHQDKKPYAAPQMMEKSMTGNFMVCSKSIKNCPPGTAIKNAGRCF